MSSLLVDPGTLDVAETALRELGNERVAIGIGVAERPRHASTWTRATDTPAVDLHTTIVGIGVDGTETWSVLRERTMTDELGGASVEVPRTDARLLLLAFHRGEHGEREQQPLQDLARALDIGTRAEWRGASSLAKRLQQRPPSLPASDCSNPDRRCVRSFAFRRRRRWRARCARRPHRP